MKNWKTNLSALVVVICGFILFSPQWFPPLAIDIAKYVALGGVAAFGISAKDFDKSGTK